MLVFVSIALVVASSPRSIVALWGGTIEQALELSWLFSVAWFGVLLGASRSSIVMRFLSQRWLAWLGTASFGVYLVHYHLLEWASVHLQRLPGSMVGWFVVALSALFGWASYHRFEKPVLDWATSRGKDVVARFASD